MGTPSNDQIANTLERMADLLEIAGENRFKLRAYRRGAERLRELPTDRFQELVEEERLMELSGIGEALSDKIQQAYREGRIDKFEETKRRFPESLLDLLQIQGMGPKSVRKVYEELSVESIPDLETAVKMNKLTSLKGFGSRTVEKINTSLQRIEAFAGRTLLMNAIPTTEALRSYLLDQTGAERVELAGSARRGKETVGDLDFLVAGVEDGEAGAVLAEYGDVEEVLAQGDTRTSIRLEDGMQVDLRQVAPESFGAAWLYFTGSKDHNVRLRERARENGWTLNEYGLFEQDSGEKLAGESEESIYRALDMAWIPPELREDHGEVDAAARGDLPELVTHEQIRGDCHIHTDASDGRHSLEEMVEEAAQQGHDYVVITEHSRSLHVADGLSVQRLREHASRIRELNDRYSSISIYTGTEVDILADGKLDYPDDVLEELDYVVASVHTKFNLDRDEQTRRITGALEHPQVDALAHPTGRMLGKRDPYEVDRDEVLKTAVRENVAIEINANGHRLDADDRWCRRGRELGVRFVISTDSHALDHLWMMRLGVGMARRGWLQAPDVLNTRTFPFNGS